jgi:hypothetical protein
LPPNCSATGSAALDDAEKPKNEDQDQQTAKTDVHGIPPVLMLLLKRRAAHHRSTRCEPVMVFDGIILPAWKVPHLLDFSAFRRK